MMIVKRTSRLYMVKRDYAEGRKVSPDFDSKGEAGQFAKRARKMGYAKVKVEPLGQKWVVTFY